MLEPREIKRWERLTDAMLKHAAQDDPEAFAQVVAVLERAQAKLPAVAAEQRGWGRDNLCVRADGYSWGDLAAALGVTRSAAQQRFGSHKITVGLSD